MSGVRIEALTGGRLKAHLPDVARLRIEVFRDFPYLYDGDLHYEARYIASFAASPDALAVVAFDGDAVVGASTAAPMAAQMAEVIEPFRARGEDLSRIFYFGNAGAPECYLGSADWMPRNFDRRVETVTPVEDPILHARIDSLLRTCLDDNRQAWLLQQDGTYLQRTPADGEAERGAHAILLKDAWGRADAPTTATSSR